MSRVSRVGRAGRASWALRRVLLVAVVAAVLLPAGPAAADPARPTHYRATVTAVVDAAGRPLPAFVTGAVEVEVLDGDAFLVVRTAPGTTVAVPGYEDEPYLRFAADGTVEVNVRSPARWLNDARYGARDVQVPPSADAQAPPVWEVVADGGTYAWHDHRIHVMAPVLPSQVDPDAGTVQRVWDTVVPLTVDGELAEVRIDLDWVPGPSPVVAALLPLVLTVALIALVLARPAAAPAVLATVAVSALAVSAATWSTIPPGGDADPALVVLPALALTLLAVGRVRARHATDDPPQPGWPADLTAPTRQVGGWLLVGAAVPLAVWATLLIPALVRPIVPGPLPLWLVRSVTALALATAAAVVTLTLRRLLAAPGADVAGGPGRGDR